MLRLILLALSVAAIAQIPAPNIVGGDVPSGASNLTTVGAIPYVSAAGILNQDPTALFWDAANDRLGIGTNAPSVALHVKGSLPTLLIENTAVNNTTLQLKTSGGLNHYIYSDVAKGNALNIATGSGTALIFSPFATESARFAPTTGNFLIGTTTDGNFRLDIATSGSSGTFRVYDQTPTTGVTKAVIRAGAGQSTTNLTEWQNSAGAVLSSTSSSGGFNVASVNSSTWWNLSPGDSANQGIEFSSTVPVRWSNASGNYAATKDLGLARNAAGVLEVNNGTAGTYRDLILRRSQHNGVTVADLPAAAAGNAGSIQYVTDANATTIGSTVAGGGANKVMVWSDGAAWKIFAN